MSMQQMYVEKVTLNIGVGKNEVQLKKGLKLLSKLAPIKPVATTTKRRIPTWGLRPGLAIGCKVTVRKGALVLLKRLLTAKRDGLRKKNFDCQGNLSFGIPEYIDIEGLEYDPDLKIMGLEVAVTLARPGYRVKLRQARPALVGKNQQITSTQAIAFVEQLGVSVQ